MIFFRGDGWCASPFSLLIYVYIEKRFKKMICAQRARAMHLKLITLYTLLRKKLYETVLDSLVLKKFSQGEDSSSWIKMNITIWNENIHSK